MTAIVASTLLERLDDAAVAQLSKESKAAGARMLELRVDPLLGAHADEAEATRLAAQLAGAVAASALPVVVTCRPVWEGGACEASEAARLALFDALARSPSPPAYVDVELRALKRHTPWWELLERLVRRTEEASGAPVARVILSLHDHGGRPPRLHNDLQAMRAAPAHVHKIVWRARSVRDNLELFELLRERDRPTIALAMGEEGALSRIAAPKFGAYAVYAPAPGAAVTAPGQLSIEALRKRYRFDRVGPSTRLYAVLGDPVAHSLSPAAHNAVFEALDLDAVYAPLRVEGSWESCKAALAVLATHPLLDFAGASVTIPHKEHACRFAREQQGWSLDPWARALGAVNTLTRLEGEDRFLASNTDAPALLNMLQSLGTFASGAQAAVLGAGGVARAAALACCCAGLAVTVHARRPEQAQNLVEELRAGVEEAADALPGCDLSALRVGSWPPEPAGAAVVVNATPVGMAGGSAPDRSPLTDEAIASLPAKAVVVETVYAPRRTKLLAQAEARSLRVVEGLELFARQAALQSALWTGAQAKQLESTIRDALREQR